MLKEFIYKNSWQIDTTKQFLFMFATFISVMTLHAAVVMSQRWHYLLLASTRHSLLVFSKKFLNSFYFETFVSVKSIPREPCVFMARNCKAALSLTWCLKWATLVSGGGQIFKQRHSQPTLNLFFVKTEEKSIMYHVYKNENLTAIYKVFL